MLSEATKGTAGIVFVHSCRSPWALTLVPTMADAGSGLRTPSNSLAIDSKNFRIAFSKKNVFLYFLTLIFFLTRLRVSTWNDNSPAVLRTAGQNILRSARPLLSLPCRFYVFDFLMFFPKPLLSCVLASLLMCNSANSFAQICTREYAPVCGQVPGASKPQTFPNRCMLDAAKATFISEGPCEDSARLTPPPLLGGDGDAHGCKPSTGYVWNEELGACARPWMSQAVTLQVAAQRKKCKGTAGQLCLMVREVEAGKKPKRWQPLKGEITGFTHQPGVSSKLRVRKDRLDEPPVGGPSIRYTLIKVLP